MSTSGAMTRTPPISGRGIRLGVIAAGLVTLAQLPFLILYATNLWQYRPHYEFFPIVLLVVAYLVWKRWPAEAVPSERAIWLEYGLLGGGLAGLMASVVLFSPWLSAVAAVLTSGGILLHLGGRAALKQLWPVWALLWLIIPPSRYDQTLIDHMQSLTTRASSRVLDLLNIGHVRAGNTIELPGKQLFVAEACSGVHSQLVLVACSAIFVVLARRPLFRGALLIASAFIWATLVNIVRVTTVAISAATSDLDLATGWQHEVLGFGLVGIGMLLVVSTDQFLGMLLAPIDPGSSTTTASGKKNTNIGTRNPLARLWNRFIASPVSAEERDTASEDELSKNCNGKWKFGSTSRVGKVFVGSFCLLGILELAVLNNSEPAVLDTEELTAAFDEASLPANVDNWQRLHFTTEIRDRSSNEGECSQIWKYGSGSVVAHISMDYPFVGWHELTNCYEGRGWHIDSQEIRPVVAGHQHAGDFMEVAMSLPTGERGFLLYSLFDGAGRPVVAGESHGQRLLKKLQSNPLSRAIGVTQTTSSPDAISIQVQQFLQLGAHPTAEEREQAVGTFLQFRDQLRARWLEQRGE
jgi:exosortase